MTLKLIHPINILISGPINPINYWLRFIVSPIQSDISNQKYQIGLKHWTIALNGENIEPDELEQRKHFYKDQPNRPHQNDDIHPLMKLIRNGGIHHKRGQSSRKINLNNQVNRLKWRNGPLKRLEPSENGSEMEQPPETSTQNKKPTGWKCRNRTKRTFI